MKPKYNKGDKVILNPDTKRMPKYVLDNIRFNRKRTIVARFYDQQSEHMRYYVGSNKISEDISSHKFRSDELILAPKRKRGRPKIRRRYQRHNGKIPE